MAPIHRIRGIIESGDYLSPQQLWHDHEWPRIYTKQIIVNLAMEMVNEPKLQAMSKGSR